MRFPSLRRHSRFARDLDAYVDGELAHARVRELEEHLARCTSCTRIVEELQLFKRMAAALPDVAAPRSFRLTAAMVAEQPKTEPLPAVPRWQLNLARGAAAIAIFGLVATVTVDLARGGGSGSSNSASAPKATSFESAADASKFGAGSASGATAPSAQSAPANPNPAVASPTLGVQNTPPRAGVLPSATVESIGPAPISRGSGGTTPAGDSRSSTSSSSGSDKTAYRFVEIGLAAAVVLFAGAVLYLLRKERRDLE